MQLINCRTLELEEYIGDQIPPYTILSHTWEQEEVTYQDFTTSKDWKIKKGAAKIENICRLTLEHDKLEYTWVDTCCIDKKSSAELVEAVNSMFKWYERARKCYVYLSDYRARSEEYPGSKLAQCRWFTRGWTLQELIAPDVVWFFDYEWKYIGSKSILQDNERDLSEQLSAITGIPENVLSGFVMLSSLLVAQRMSWASRRQTTREEDLAYCLLGIFDISLPLIYGEGPRAFIRLQEEIMKERNDLSIFAWQTNRDDEFRGILADSPAEFSKAGSLKFLERGPSPMFTMTNKGLHIETVMNTTTVARQLALPLYCIDSSNPKGMVGITLRLGRDFTFVRDRPHELYAFDKGKSGAVKSIYISKRGRGLIYWTEHAA